MFVSTTMTLPSGKGKPRVIHTAEEYGKRMRFPILYRSMNERINLYREDIAVSRSLYVYCALSGVITGSACKIKTPSSRPLA